MTSSPIAPTPRVAPRPRCALCDCAGVVIHPGVPDHYFGVPGKWSLKRCENRACGLIWQDPMVIAEDLGMAYRNYYTHGAPSSGHAGLHASVIDLRFYRLDRWMTRLLRLDAERRNFASSYLEDVTPGSVLDVGCGSGIFADVLQRQGWRVRGSDFDPVAARAATQKYGFPVDVGELSDIAHADASFDAVTARHVIEHVPDPSALLAECWRILKPGGRLVFITPNAASLGHRYFGGRWRGLEQPRHLFLYDVGSMKALFHRAGIETVDVFSTPQGADFVAAETCRTSGGPFQRWSDYAAIWWLYLSEGILVASGRQVGEELVAFASKPSSGRARL